MVQYQHTVCTATVAMRWWVDGGGEIVYGDFSLMILTLHFGPKLDSDQTSRLASHGNYLVPTLNTCRSTYSWATACLKPVSARVPPSVTESAHWASMW